MNFEAEKEKIKRKALALKEIDKIDAILDHGGVTGIVFGGIGDSMRKGDDPFYDSVFDAVTIELKSALISEIVPPEPAKMTAPKKKKPASKKKKNGSS